MVDSVALRWILTAAFAAIGVLYLVRGLRARGRAWTQRVSCTAHVLMCAAMVAMAWPWGMHLPVYPQVVAFALAALWFLWLTRSRDAGPGRLYDLHHVVIMAATAVMVGSMPTLMRGAGSDLPHAMDMSHRMDMSQGMDMPGMDGHSAGGVPGYLIGVSAVLACYFLIYVLWLLSRTVRSRRAGPALERGCQGVMSVGMAVMLLAVL